MPSRSFPPFLVQTRNQSKLKKLKCYHQTEKSLVKVRFAFLASNANCKADKRLFCNIVLKAVCLLAVAGVAIGVALIWLSFLLIPLVSEEKYCVVVRGVMEVTLLQQILARFFVYLFQPLINFMVGKKPIFHDRIRVSAM